jgi:type IV pilus assembly protein PilQ
VRQVLIESRIVVVNDDFERDLGARVGLTTVNANGNGVITTSGTAAATDSDHQSAALTNDATHRLALPGVLPTGTTGAPERYNVNLPVATRPAASLSVFSVTTSWSTSSCRPRRRKRSAAVISSPRVITANQKEATIEQGTKFRISSRLRAARPRSASRRRCCR